MDREVGYTTTLKFLQIMFDKGLVSREKAGKTHIYQAVLSENQAQQSLVNDLLDNAFKGSAMKLVMGALGSRKSSKKELDAIRKYLDELEGGEE
jgi:predicted transcriptional regulator